MNKDPECYLKYFGFQVYDPPDLKFKEYENKSLTTLFIEGVYSGVTDLFKAWKRYVLNEVG